MAKKRKQESKVTEPSEPPKKQQLQEPTKKIEEEEEEEEEDEEEEEFEEINEEDEEEDEEEEESDDDEEDSSDDDDEEPIEKLLELFGKDQLITLLKEVANKHDDVADRIRSICDEDPVHRKIFVHGLGWDTNTETLMKAFKCYGEIEDCKAVVDKATGKSKGYGFILFKKRSGARNALKEPQKKIGNRLTACQLASVGPVPAGGSGGGGGVAGFTFVAQQQASEYTQRKIYVSNVGPELDPKKLTAYFSKFGEIEEGPLGIDKATGKFKGFCLFVYKTVESAKRALEEPHKSFEGHILYCQRAIDGPKPGKSQQPMQQQKYRSTQRHDNASYAANVVGGPGHLMASAATPSIGFNQGVAAAAATPVLNPAIGQALTALLASQGAGLGLTNLLGTLGSASAVTAGTGAVPGVTPALQAAYGNQAGISPGVIGNYATQGTIQGGFPNQQIGQGGSGRGQHGVRQYGGYLGQ